jgi:hypothetical protein
VDIGVIIDITERMERTVRDIIEGIIDIMAMEEGRDDIMVVRGLTMSLRLWVLPTRMNLRNRSLREEFHMKEMVNGHMRVDIMAGVMEDAMEGIIGTQEDVTTKIQI